MNTLTVAVIAFLVPLVLSLARKYLPVPTRLQNEKQYSRDELNTRFGTTKWLVGSSMLLVGGIFAFATYEAFLRINHYLGTAGGKTQFFIAPQSAIWWFLPLFGALGLSSSITLEIWALLGHREDAQLYAYWSSLKSGFDGERVLRWMQVLLVLPIGILTILALSMHTSLTEDEIRDCGYAFTSCKVYRYADARRMTVIDGFRDRYGKLNYRASIVIDFSDGRRWSSAEMGDFTQHVDPALKEFLQNKIQLPFNYAPTENDIVRSPTR